MLTISFGQTISSGPHVLGGAHRGMFPKPPFFSASLLNHGLPHNIVFAPEYCEHDTVARRHSLDVCKMRSLFPPWSMLLRRRPFLGLSSEEEGKGERYAARCVLAINGSLFPCEV